MLKPAAAMLLFVIFPTTASAQVVDTVPDLLIIANQHSTRWSGTTPTGVRLGQASGGSGTMTGGQYVPPGTRTVLSAYAGSRPFGSFGGVSELARYRINITFPDRPADDLVVPHPGIPGEEFASGTLTAPASYFLSHSDFETGFSFVTSLEDDPWPAGIAEVDYMWYTSETFRDAGEANGLYSVNQVRIVSVPEPQLYSLAAWLFFVMLWSRRR